MAFQSPKGPEDGQPALEQEPQLAEERFPFQICQLLPSQKQLSERAHRTELQDMGEPGFQLFSCLPEIFCPKDPLQDLAFPIPGFPGKIRHLLHLLLYSPFGTEKEIPP